MTAPSWLYERSGDGTARFLLGTQGENPLVFFGVNPSTARPGELDPTVRRVARFAQDLGHDSWVMLNLYPQIATDPRHLHDEEHRELTARNERAIARHVAGRPLPLVAAWGSLVSSRRHLRPLVERIARLEALAACAWFSFGAPTRDGHPRHPLYLRADTPLRPFPLEDYLGLARRAQSREP